MKQYSQMKDSGVEWIGDIPEHWHIDKIKYHFDIITGKVLQLKQKTSDDVLVDYITAGNILWEKVNLQELSKMWANEIEIKKIKVRNNDLLICEGGEAGRSAILSDLKNECIIQNHVHRLRSKNNSSCKFLLYLMEFFNSSGILKSMIARVTISSLPRLTLANFPMIVPKNEQKEISDYLDKKIKNIDNEISKNQKLIELINDKRESVINHAVTKGLDDTVQMKDSRIQWIGDIPKQWEIRKIKYSVYPHRKVTYGIVQPGQLDKNGVLLIRGRDYISGWHTKGDIFKVSKELHQKFIRAKVISGDILMCIVGATTGAVNQIPDGIKEANITQTTARIACDQSKMISKFMLYSLDSRLGKIQVANNIKGAAQPGLNLVMVENFVVCFPKILEQKQIVNHLDEKIGKIDSLISKMELQIKQLREFRESLISSAVTGKIQVAQA